MRVLVMLLLSLLQLGSLGYGTAFHSLQSYLFFTSRQTSRRHSHRAAAPVPASLFLPPSEPPRMQVMTHMGPAYAPAHAPRFEESAPTPSPASKHHRRVPNVHPPTSFYPPPGQDCDVICRDPLTTTPFGSPCGCVLPMQVELDLGVAPFRVFSVVAELEVEVAAGTYLKQSQVRIMGAAASGQDEVKTKVDIDLVPLGEKFDNMTALLTYERFWQKRVPINASIFGDYEVIFVRYPGLPPLPNSGAFGPSGSEGYPNPFFADVTISKNKKLNVRTIAIIALSSFILVLTFIGVVFIFTKWRKLRRSSTTVDSGFTPSIAKRSGFRSMVSSSLASSTSVSLVSTMATCPPSVKTFSLAELENATEKFSSKRVLGEGGFGRVYHGTMEDGIEVAIKLLTREDQSGDREFIVEVMMLSRLHHRNLVKLIGICIEGHTRCLVYELVRNGSVESHLHGADRAHGPLDWDTRLKIALGAARGLAYLHEDSNPRVIHRDFKASNVLLENDFTPKVSDFGLAREASEGIQHISTRVMGTFGYVAPEYAMTGHLLVKSDVYSYGVVLLELLSGRKPVDNSQPHGQESLVTWARPLLTSREGLEQLVDPSLDGNYDFDNMAKVAAIASRCVHPEVSQRPFMGEVVQALKLIYNDMDETCEDCYSQREESSAPDCDFRGGTGTDSSWWNGGTPRLTYGCASSFMTMEYSSGPVEEMDQTHSTPTLVGWGESLVRQNRSGPLQTKRHRPALSRLRGSMSEHQLLSRRFGVDGCWV